MVGRAGGCSKFVLERSVDPTMIPCVKTHAIFHYHSNYNLKISVRGCCAWVCGVGLFGGSSGWVRVWVGV